MVYAHLDGRYAMTEGDIRMCVAGDTIEDMSVKYRGNNADDSAIDSIRRISAGVMVSAHIAGVAATKQDVIVRLGTRQDAVVAQWDNATAVYDEVTGSRTGEIKLTLVQGVAWKVTRPNGLLAGPGSARNLSHANSCSVGACWKREEPTRRGGCLTRPPCQPWPWTSKALYSRHPFA